MISKVTYSGNGTFIDTLTTAYGITRFASSNSRKDKDRWIEITDPLGRTERVEARDNADTETQSPKIAGIINSDLAKHNAFYWDAQSYAKHKGDYTKATGNEGNMAVQAISSQIQLRFPG